MKFRIEKTSDPSFKNKRPISRARLDKRETDWRGRSKNHWSVEVNTLEELMRMVKRKGSIIVHSPSGDKDGLPSLEIYDDYRE